MSACTPSCLKDTSFFIFSHIIKMKIIKDSRKILIIRKLVKKKIENNLKK